MSLRLTTASALVAFAVFPTRTHAELALSLEDAVARAESFSPLVRRTRLERGVVAATRNGAAILLPSNPALSGSLGGRTDASGSLPAAQGLEGALRLEQTVEIAGQRGKRLDEVAAAVRVAKARERLALVETRARVRITYLAALIAQTQVDNARRREDLGHRILDSARARVKAGAASDVEVHLAEVENGRLVADRVDAEISEADAAAELRRLLDLPNTPMTLTTKLSRPPLSAQSLAQLLEQARARRADLRVLDERRSQLDAAVIRLRREVVPNPTLYLDFARQQPGQTYIGGGISLPIPLWRRNQGELAVARAEQELIAGERALIDSEIGIQVERAQRTSIARDKQTEAWERDVVPAAEANVELVSEGWRAGKFDLFRVIQVTREAGEAHRRQLELLGAVWQAVVELDRVTGALP